MPKFGDDFEFPDGEKASADGDKNKFEVEIEDDTPPADRGRKPMKEKVEDPTDDELNSYDEKVQNRIKKFTRGYHDERRAKEEALREREAAETFAKQVLEENKRLQKQLADGSQEYIATSKSAAETELNAAKTTFKQAYESGDAEAIANAQAEIARATHKVEKAQGMKPIEVEDKQWEQSQTQQPNSPPPRTQKWISRNSDWFGVDEEMTMTAMGIDKRLQKEYGSGYVGTKEYFKTIDKTMRKRFPERFDDDQSQDEEKSTSKKVSPAEDDTPRRASKPATVVAPASRSTSPNRVKVKASEAAIARRLGVSVEDYARQKAALEGNR
jgi:LysM repeat protein